MQLCSMVDLPNKVKANLQRKRGKKKALHLLNYSIAPNKTFRFLLINQVKIFEKNIISGARGMNLFIK